MCYGVNQKSNDLTPNLGDDDNMPLRGLGQSQSKARGQIDDRQHRAAQVDHAA